MKQFESFALDTRNECLWHQGAQLSLPPKPFAVLRYLVENPDRLITHDELLDALWPETYVQPQVLRTYMLELRKVLGDEAANPRFIQTLPKRGYCFVAKVIEGEVTTKTAADERTAAANQQARIASHPAGGGVVGRGAELAQLQASLVEAAKGQRQAVFVTGEVGIGKTALVDAFTHVASADAPGAGGILTVRGQCVEGFGGKEEYYPIVEVLSQLCASPEGERACRVLSTMAPAWMDASRREANPGAPEGDRRPGDICAALEALSAEKPLILILEDLHWADEATLHLISALARRRGEAKLMLVLTCRPLHTAGNGGSSLKGLRQDLRMKRLSVDVALTPLSKTEVKELLRRELKQEDLPQGLASFVHQHSEGNPLFAIALVEHLIAQGFLERSRGEDPSWEQRAPFQEMEAGVPDGLAQMIELEIERLSVEEQSLLEAGSLMHVAFPAWAVATALGKDPAETEEACDHLARRLHFVERAGQDELPDGTRSNFYAFAHGLYREVLYQRQAASRRTQRHIRIAERLRELFRGREANVARDIALHYEAAGDWRRAVEALRGAAHHASKRDAHGEAEELLERALRIADSMGDSRDLEAIRSELNAGLARHLDREDAVLTDAQKA